MSGSNFIFSEKESGLGLMTVRGRGGLSSDLDVDRGPTREDVHGGGVKRGSITPSKPKVFDRLSIAKPRLPVVSIKPSVQPAKPDKKVDKPVVEVLKKETPQESSAIIDFYKNNKTVALVGGGIGGLLLVTLLLK